MSKLSDFYGGGGYGTTPGAKIPVEILLVGGGGGGAAGGGPSLPASTAGGGGGGAGLVLYKRLNARVGVPYPITIGAGGAGGAARPGPAPLAATINHGSFGGNTTFDFVTAFGGGGGLDCVENNQAYLSVFYGGCYGSTGGFSGTNGNLPGLKGMIEASTYRYRGSGYHHVPTSDHAGGGGGAGELSKTDTIPSINAPSKNMDGGAGLNISSFIGIASTIAGGGGGGKRGNGNPLPPSHGGDLGFGAAGGGNGGYSPLIDATSATANTGSGGGGGYTSSSTPVGGAGGSGGSGFLVVRYPTQYSAATVSGNTPTPPQPGFNVYRWNSGPGSITFN